MRLLNFGATRAKQIKPVQALELLTNQIVCRPGRRLVVIGRVIRLKVLLVDEVQFGKEGLVALQKTFIIRVNRLFDTAFRLINLLILQS